MHSDQNLSKTPEGKCHPPPKRKRQLLPHLGSVESAKGVRALNFQNSPMVSSLKLDLKWVMDEIVSLLHSSHRPCPTFRYKYWLLHQHGMTLNK